MTKQPEALPPTASSSFTRSSAATQASILVSQEAGERNATRATPSDEAAAYHKARRPVLTAALIDIIVIPFVQIVLGLAALLQQLDQERATYAPPAQDAAGYQEAQELALAIGAFLADVLVALVQLVLVLIFPLATPTPGALSEETRYQGATDTAAPEHPAAEDQAQELALVIASRLLAFLVVIILVRLILTTLGALFDEMREEDSAHTPAPQQAAAKERAHELTVVISTLFVVRVLVSIFLRPFRSLAQESCDECAADPAVANHFPADCEFREIFSFPCIGAHVVLLWLCVASNG